MMIQQRFHIQKMLKLHFNSSLNQFAIIKSKNKNFNFYKHFNKKLKLI